jgi:hypothetical protein
MADFNSCLSDSDSCLNRVFLGVSDVLGKCGAESIVNFSTTPRLFKGVDDPKVFFLVKCPRCGVLVLLWTWRIIWVIFYCAFTLSQLIHFVGNNSQELLRGRFVLLLVLSLLLDTVQSFPSRFVWGPRDEKSLTDDP